jgi:hypothetical protein
MNYLLCEQLGHLRDQSALWLECRTCQRGSEASIPLSLWSEIVKEGLKVCLGRRRRGSSGWWLLARIKLRLPSATNLETVKALRICRSHSNSSNIGNSSPRLWPSHTPPATRQRTHSAFKEPSVKSAGAKRSSTGRQIHCIIGVLPNILGICIVLCLIRPLEDLEFSNRTAWPDSQTFKDFSAILVVLVYPPRQLPLLSGNDSGL